MKKYSISSTVATAFAASALMLTIGAQIASAAATPPISPPPVSGTGTAVYEALPSPLAPNYPSQPFQAQQTSEFGDYVHLGGTARLLTTINVTMSDWAVATSSENIAFCAASASNCDATGFFWPITVNVYSNHLGANGAPDTLLATKTVTQHIPWRPGTDPSCTGAQTGDWKASDGNCYGGIAANITFDLSSLNVTLPNDVIVTLAYNTETYGASPVGVDGPYDSLNVAVPPNDLVTIGSDDNVDHVFWNTVAANYTNHACLGGTLCEDTNWTPYGTVAMEINAISLTNTVTITKFIDGTMATAASANSMAFPMVSTWANIPSSGSGSYDLSTADSYQAMTAQMNSGASYTTNEVTTGNTVVGASCAAGEPYALVGYSTGTSQAAAASSTVSMTVPNFTNITQNEYVIVWNKNCLPAPTLLTPPNGTSTTTAGLTGTSWSAVTDPAGGITYVYQSSNASTTNPDGSFTTPAFTSGPLSTTSEPTPGTPAGMYWWHVQATDADGNMSPWSNAWMFTVNNTVTPPTTVQAHIFKYLDGVQATASSSNNASFPMFATWSAQNSGTNVPFTLSPSGWTTGDAPYEASTEAMTSGASYNATENLSTSLVGASCDGSHTYALVGYTSGATLAAAKAASVSTTSPNFTNMTTDKYEIVWNKTCSTTPPPPPTSACNTPTVAPAGYTIKNGAAGNASVTLAPFTMFVGKAGNPTITGGAGDYIVCLANGNATVNLGNGDNAIVAGNGNANITVGNGTDSITVGNGNSKITTGNGNKTVHAGNGNNTIKTGSGNDTITSGNGNSTINAGNGTDSCTVGAGMSTLTSCNP